MALSSLSLTQFRNHEATRLQAGARFNVIWGDQRIGLDRSLAFERQRGLGKGPHL